MILQAIGQAAGGLIGGAALAGNTGAMDLVRRTYEQAAIDNGTAWSGYWPWISEPEARAIIPLTSGLRLLAGVVMQMPLRQYRGEDQVIPPATVVANPAPANAGTLATYVEGYINDVCLYGNHVAIIGEPDSTGWPTWILPVDVTQVAAARDEGGRIIYSYAGTDAYLTTAEIVHVALDRRSGEINGRGLIPTFASGLRAVVSAEEYAGRYFDESAIPTGVITDARPDLTQDQATDLKTAWLSTVGGRRRTPIVLPSTTTFQPLVTDADSSQLVQARQWNAQTVAMALGIPPFLMGVATDPHTYTNAQNEFDRLLKTSVLRLLVPLEQQFSLQLLPRGNEARFDPTMLLRPDMAARVNMAIAGFNAHLFTEGEARQLMGYPSDGGPGTGPASQQLPSPQLKPQLALVPGEASSPQTGANA
jgi:HK97 family phage portal protein